VEWVHRESGAAGESLRLPGDLRDAVLRERGDDLLRHRFGPLLEEP
jgi:hypothetical protein